MNCVIVTTQFSIELQLDRVFLDRESPDPLAKRQGKKPPTFRSINTGCDLDHYSIAETSAGRQASISSRARCTSSRAA